jgi:thiol-disulfide isomerase/thioredoxin
MLQYYRDFKKFIKIRIGGIYMKFKLITVILFSFVFIFTSCNKNNNEQNKISATNQQEKDGTFAKNGENEKSKEKFPEFSTKDLNGKDFDNNIFGANKVTLINYWATWCGPCRTELPDLDALNNDLKSKGASVVGVVSDAVEEKGLKEAQNLLKKSNLLYTNLISNSAIDRFVSSKSQYIPTSFLVDSQGYIIGEPIIGAMNKEKYLKIVTDALNLQ